MADHPVPHPDLAGYVLQALEPTRRRPSRPTSAIAMSAPRRSPRSTTYPRF